jgi:ABC-2 type transport system permease protein
VVATLVKLRFLLLINGIRKSPWQIVAVVLGGLYGLFLLVTVVGLLIFLRTAPIDLARTVVVLAGAAVVLGWTFLPVLTSGIDQTVDTARLAPFPVRINTLLLALAVSGVLGVPGIVTSIAALGTVVTWSRDPLAAFAALVAAVIGVLTAVVGSRMLAALASRVGAGRRAREAKTLLVFIPLLLLGPIIVVAANALRDVKDVLPTVAQIVGWTPLGAAWAVPADVASGDFAKAGLELLIALATLAIFVALWRWGLARALERPARATTGQVSRRGSGLFGVFPGTPTGAVAARALTYWIRDPRYAQSLVTIPIVPALLFFWGGFGENLAILVWVGPVVAVLLAMSIYTDVSYDNTAFALHVQTGVSGRADRVGRVLALATFAVPASLLLVFGSVAVSGTWQFLTGLLGITAGILLSGFAVSSIVSGRFTFAVPAPGESPFKAKPGGGFSLMLSTFASWAVLGILVLPELALALLGFATGEPLWGILSIAVGLVLGSALLVVGVRVGGRILERRGPELLAQLQKQK